MTTAPQIKKAGDDKHWLVKNEQGETFGPVDFETLKLWAKDGRLAPTNTLSEDTTTWNAITQYPELEMDWVAEVSPGVFYGPIHKLALESLQQEGSLPPNAVTFQRPLPVKAAAKTQPIAAICSVPPPPPQKDTDALRALEHQLDLERQRSQDIMKELQQAEVLVATAEARIETSERAVEHQLDFERQRSQDIMKELQQVKVLVATAEARAETSEKAHQHYAAQSEQAQHHLVSKLETLIQDCMMRFGTQHQEILSVVTSAQPHVDVLPAKESSPAPSNIESQSIFLAALSQAQSHIVKQVTQHAGEAFTQTQEQMRNTASSAHDQLDALVQAQSHSAEQVAKQLGDAFAQTQEQIRTAASSTHDQLDALAQAQSHIVKQVTQHVDATFTKTQEQMCKTTSSAHEQAVQHMAAAHEQMRIQFAAALASAQTHITAELCQSFISELAKTQSLFSSALLTSQQEAASQVTQAITQAITQATATITAQLTQHRQELERFGTLLTTSRAQAADAVVHAVADLLAKGREDLLVKISAELASCHDLMFERTHTALTHGREQMMRATGDSQRIAIEYIGREFHASQQHLEAEFKAALERSIKAVNKPVVERTYIKAENVEVLPPERPHKKPHPEPHPEPEPVKPPPPPTGKTGATHATGQGLSMADIEQQARRELERLGAQGMNIFKRK